MSRTNTTRRRSNSSWPYKKPWTPGWMLVSTVYMHRFTSPLTDVRIAARDKSDKDAVKTTVRTRPFLKLEEGNLFHVLPVLSAPLFPQFKGFKSPGVVRAKCQQGISLPTTGSPTCLTTLYTGRMSLNPTGEPSKFPLYSPPLTPHPDQGVPPPTTQDPGSPQIFSAIYVIRRHTTRR